MTGLCPLNLYDPLIAGSPRRETVLLSSATRSQRRGPHPIEARYTRCDRGLGGRVAARLTGVAIPKLLWDKPTDETKGRVQD